MPQENQNLEEIENIVEAAEETELTQDTAEDTKSVDNTAKLSPEDQLSELQKKRMGSFEVEMSHADATYFRNVLQKSEWKGPQQAYLLVIAKAELDNVVISLGQGSKDQRHKVELSSAVIESLNFFLNNKIGKGVDSANKLFYASMVLRPSMIEISGIDNKIKEIQASLAGNK